MLDGQTNGGERLGAWLEMVAGTPEEYWQKLTEEKRANGVELGEMPELAETERAIEYFFTKGVKGVMGAAREMRKELTKKAILHDIAKLKERGGELDETTKRNVFYGTQRMLEEMYRKNRELREAAKNEKLGADEAVAWHLKMEPRGAKVNVLTVMREHVRKAGEGSDEYEARLRNYVEDGLRREAQLEADRAYNAEHPDRAAEYAARVRRNGQREDLPEYEGLEWEAAARPMEEIVAEDLAGMDEQEWTLVQGDFDGVSEAEMNTAKKMSLAAIDQIMSELNEKDGELKKLLEAKRAEIERQENTPVGRTDWGGI